MILSNFSATATRKSGGAWVNSVWTGETTSTFTVTGSLQPLTAFQMATLPEGRQGRASYTLITKTVLQTVTSQNPDTISIAGVDFEVWLAQPWGDKILSHGEYILQEKHPVNAPS